MGLHHPTHPADRPKANPPSPLFQGLFRGTLPWFLMRLLREGPHYGSDMIRSISEHTGSAWKPSPGSVYPVLRSLEADGLIKGDWHRSKGAPQRIYRLTAKGKRALPKMQRQVVEHLVAMRRLIDEHLAMLT